MRTFFIVALSVALFDQGAKAFVETNLYLHEIRRVIPGLFNLTYVTNTGAAFGIMAGKETWRHIFFQIMSILALGGIAYLYHTARSQSRLLFWGCSLVFGGALGNLIDRMRNKYVTDFLDFHIGPHHWPAFNVADSAITVGAVCLALFFLMTPED